MPEDSRHITVRSQTHTHTLFNTQTHTPAGLPTFGFLGRGTPTEELWPDNVAAPPLGKRNQRRKIDLTRFLGGPVRDNLVAFLQNPQDTAWIIRADIDEAGTLTYVFADWMAPQLLSYMRPYLGMTRDEVCCGCFWFLMLVAVD